MKITLALQCMLLRILGLIVKPIHYLAA